MAEKSSVLISDVINQALPPGASPFDEAEIIAQCEQCSRAVPASTCVVTSGSETTYACPSCSSILVVIGPPNPDGKPGRGFRIKDFVIRNAVDLNAGGVVIPKSPNALAKQRPTD